MSAPKKGQNRNVELWATQFANVGRLLHLAMGDSDHALLA